MPGPPPKRSDQRRRRNKTGELTVVDFPVNEAPKVNAPEPSDLWHPLMQDWFSSLARSGQSMYYQDSDWQTARLMASIMSDELSTGHVRAQMLQEFSRVAASLMTTEGERRRLRMEISAGEQAVTVDEETASVMSEYRDMFNA